MAFEQIYAAELARLHSLGQEFATENPTIASYLSGGSGDPDVERLLQGFAFLTAMVRQKMDDELPEFIGDVVSLVGPDLISPLPAAAVLALSASGKLPDGYAVKANTPFASIRVLETACQFSTSWPIAIQPIKLTGLNLQALGRNRSTLTLELEMLGQPLNQWTGHSLALYLSGPYPEATTILMALRQHLTQVSVRSAGQTDDQPLALTFNGLDASQHLFQTNRSIAPHLQWIREVLAFPERAFFIQLQGFESWTTRGSGREFVIEFELELPTAKLPKPALSHFTLNAVPAVNLFEAYVNPIEVTHLKESYRLEPMGYEPGRAVVHDVLTVTGRVQGQSEEKYYRPTTDLLVEDDALKYQVVASDSVKRSAFEQHIRLPFNRQLDLARRETLSIKVRCTNGRLPESLRLGDISLRTTESPEKVTVTNVTLPTGWSLPALGVDAMWKVVAHARLNLQAFAEIETLKEMLSVYLPEGGGDPGRLTAARRRIAGIEEVALSSDSRLVRGSLVRGYIVRLKLRLDYYASAGDLMLFGELLSPFFAGLVGLNSFVTLVVADPVSGEQFEWPTLLAPDLML
jgi:type VI secretion system protein ImpG